MHTLEGISSLSGDFEHLPDADRVLMHHIPTRATFEIVYDADQAVLGGLTIFGFAARLYDLGDGGQPPDNADELAAIGHNAIVAFLCDECPLAHW
jgi:hypothetical protein